MYLCDLINNCRYTIIWKEDKDNKNTYWGVDTQRRNILLFNVRRTDNETIERYLIRADIQYYYMYR